MRKSPVKFEILMDPGRKSESGGCQIMKTTFLHNLALKLRNLHKILFRRWSLDYMVTQNVMRSHKERGKNIRFVTAPNLI